MFGMLRVTAEPEPPQLASRTCHFVEHAIQKSQSLCQRGSAAKSLSESHDPLVSPSRWSLADLGVGICILGAVAALVLPGLHVDREKSRRTYCQYNMHQIGAALMDYAVRFDRGLPQINAGDNAGLVCLGPGGQRRVLSREDLARLVVCPSSELAERVSKGCIIIKIPTRQELQEATGARRDQFLRYMAGDVAYTIGYRDANGKLRQVRSGCRRDVPVLSDAPSAAIAGYQSANHGGCGQNVLFQDLSCRYCTQCKSHEQRDHWFLNDEGQVAAGCREDDIVLGSSDATPVIDLRAE